MDPLFDAIDRAMESVRHRWPRTLFAVEITLWLLATAVAVGVAVLSGGAVPGIVLAVPSAALLIIVGMGGLDRVGWPVWPIGVLMPVLLAGLLAPLAQRFHDPFDWLAPIVVFLYAQIFLGAVGTADELYRRRPAPPAPLSPHSLDSPVPAAPEASAFTERRLLQVKILVATMVVIGSAQAAVSLSSDGYQPGNAVGASGFEGGVSCLALPMLLGVWWRRRGLAWYAVAVLPALFLLSLLPRSPEARWETVLSQGWIVVAATWQWRKAAVKPFWRDPPRPSPPPAWHPPRAS
jgi:hypothetical protein